MLLCCHSMVERYLIYIQDKLVHTSLNINGSSAYWTCPQDGFGLLKPNAGNNCSSFIWISPNRCIECNIFDWYHYNDYLSPLFNTSKNTLAFCSFNIFQLLFPCQSNHCPKMNRPGLEKLELLEYLCLLVLLYQSKFFVVLL